MRALALTVLLIAGPAFADSKTKTPPEKPAPTEKAKCKKVGKKTVCSAEIEVKSGPSKPGVVVVPTDGRKVVGRPKSDDRLNGLGPHTK